jgi:hypothetical protein
MNHRDTIDTEIHGVKTVLLCVSVSPWFKKFVRRIEPQRSAQNSTEVLCDSLCSS